MLETRDQKVFYHQKNAPLLFNNTSAICNLTLSTLALRIFTFFIYSVRRIRARRPSALAIGRGTLHTILSTNAPRNATVRRTVASD